MKNFLIQLAFKLPSIIAGAVSIQDNVKKAGKDKFTAVASQVDEAADLIEYAAGKDLFLNENLAALRDAAIEAEVAALKARNALRQGILNHAQALPDDNGD